MDRRSNWALGDSPTGIFAATSSEPQENMLKVVTNHRRSTLLQFLQVTLPKIAKQWTSRPFAFFGRAPQTEPWMWQESQTLQMANTVFNDGAALFFDQGHSSKKRGLNGQPIEEYRPIDGADVSEWKGTLCKIEEGTSIMWEVFVAFLRIHRVTADGCTCANYCMLAMCVGVLLWLLVKEPNFKVPSQCSWEIVAQHPFKLGRIERKVTARAEPSTKVRTRRSEKLASHKKKALTKSRRKVVAGSDTDSDANVSTLALNPPSAEDFTSTTVAAPMDVHQRPWHCLNLFRPPYVCGQCLKTVYLWCMHCEGFGFCLHTLGCPVRGRAHPNTDKWPFQKWC